MAFLDTYKEESMHRKIYGKTPCREPAGKVLILEFLIPRIKKNTNEHIKLMELYAKFNIGLPGPCSISENGLSIVPPIGTCSGSSGIPPVKPPLTSVRFGVLPGPTSNLIRPTEPTIAEIEAVAAVDYNTTIKLSLDLSCNDTQVMWIAIKKDEYKGRYNQWFESSLNKGDIDPNFVGGASSSYIFFAGEVTLPEGVYDLYMTSYVSAFLSTLELFKI